MFGVILTRRSAVHIVVQLNKHRSLSICFILAGRNELVLASLNGKVQGVHVHFSRHSSPALWPTGVGELSGSDP